MHRALLLPEIVQAIVRAGKTEPDLLYSCLFVNKTFSHEACRILWKGCYGGFGVGHVSPSVGDLGRMVENPEIGLDRAQSYANCIRVLVFRDNPEPGPEWTFPGWWETGSYGHPGGHPGEDAKWHPQLCQLEFPMLEDLNIGKTRSAKEVNTESHILHYVHSGLRDLRVDASAPLSDHFLDEVSRLCPYLQHLDMDFKKATISKEGLACFLKQMYRLEGIHVAALDNSWSAAAFAAVAKYERLKLLHVPSIHDSWFDDIEVSTSFPALKQLYALDTTGKALLRLSIVNSGLEVIHLYNDNLLGPEDVVSAVSNFPQLTAFKYLSNCSAAVSGQDLMTMARGCPSLTTLIVGQISAFTFNDDLYSTPQIVDIDDSVITSIAQSLPSLKAFQIIGRYEPYPSLHAVLSSFSQHCPLLERLDISCGSDWVTFAHVSPHEWLFAHLTTLTLNPRAHLEESLSDTYIEQLLQCFKSFAPRWFPALEFFNIIDADDREQELLDFIYELADNREYGSDEENMDGEDGRDAG